VAKIKNPGVETPGFYGYNGSDYTFVMYANLYNRFDK